MSSFTTTTLGRTGLTVCRLGIGSSYGMPAKAVERAVESGVNYLYWGSIRRDGFAEGVRNLAPRRERMILVIQSFSRMAPLVGWSLERALRRLKVDFADVLLLGLWNQEVAPRVLEAAVKLRERGLARFLALSTHHRPLVAGLAAGSPFDVFHVRYNAIHRGAEREIFPHLTGRNRPGLVAFTATSWKQLLGHRRIPSEERTPTAGDCYRFVLSQPAIDICLTGPATEAHMEHALAALEKGPMTESELAWMQRVGDAIYGRRELVMARES